MTERVGVFVCHCGTNIGKMVRVKEVVDFAASLPNVAFAAEHKYMCSDPGQAMIQEMIKEHNLTRAVVASCSPLMHENTFRRTVSAVNMNPFLMQMANIREQASWVSFNEDEATGKAKKMIAAAVRRVVHHDALTITKVKVHPEVLVIGGGVAGMEAALAVANSGVHVYLVEKQESIGGKAALYDKTFPTLDCAACILTPKMTSVSQHPNITLMTLSEVAQVDGSVGDFWVTVRTKPRYVDTTKCTACKACIEKCPTHTDSPYEFGLTDTRPKKEKRKAIDMAYAQAVPNKPYIDPEACLKITKDKCGLCQKECPVDAIHFDDAVKETKIHVGSMIVTTGFELVDPLKSKTLARYGYRRYDNVFTSLEMERMTSSSGPTGGKIVLRDFKTEPKSVAILHCIGSRDKHNNEYCSRFCCMASMKMAHLIKERAPQAKIYNLYIDVRAAGKGYEQFYRKIMSEGIEFIKGKGVDVNQIAQCVDEEGKLVVSVEDTTLGAIRRLPVDMVVLSLGLTPDSTAEKLGQTLHISRSADGFFLERHPKLAPVNVGSDGIFIAGCCQSPKDIPDSVAQALGAASQAMIMVLKGEVALEPTVAEILADHCTGCKTCLRVCPYNAISFDEDRKVSRIDASLCKGCGTCVAACPSNAIKQWGFDDEQIYAELEGMLNTAI